MSKKEPESTFPDVAGLMAERQQYEAWLAALDARRDSTPRHVFQRVRSDYEKRLREVVGHLSTHRSELEERLVTLTKRVTELETEEQARRDERAELELRSAVGELSPEGYEKQAADCDRQIAEISSQRTSVREEAERTREFLEAAVRPSPALQQEAVPEPRAGTPAQTPSQPAPRSPTPAAPGSPAAPRAPRPGFDELAFLNAVVGDKGPEQPPQRVSTERPAVAEPEAAQEAAPEATREPPREPPRPAKLPKAEPRTSRPEPRVSGQRRASKPDWIAKDPLESLDTITPSEDSDIVHDGPPPLAANISGNHPIVLRSSGQVDNSKTLKCAECGAMNYPTEWYCERCGAELAAL